MTAIDSNSLLQATGTAGVEESTPSIPTTRRRRRRPKSSISSDAESDLYLPDPVTPKAPKAKASRRSDEGLEHTLPTTVAESLALETDTVQTLTPKPKRRASGPKNTIVLTEALGSSRPYSTGTKTVGGATAPALMTPRTFPLLGAHLTLSKTHPTSLLLPVSDSDSDDVVGYDFSKLGAGVAHMRVTKQVVDGRMREMWELSSSESRMRSAEVGDNDRADSKEAVHAIEGEAERTGNVLNERKASSRSFGGVLIEGGSREELERERLRGVVVIGSDND